MNCKINNWSSVFNDIPKNRTMYFHIHVPKTGGTTFWNVLKSNFKDALAADYSKGGHPGKYNRQIIEEVIYQWDSRCFTAHNYSLSNIPFDQFGNLKAFSFVRDPIEKAISSYFFLKGRSSGTEWDLCHKFSIDYLVSNYSNSLLERPWLFDCSQIDFIVGNQKSNIDTVVSFTDSGVFHLFPLERFDDAMICLEKLYPEDFLDCSFGTKSNISTKDQEVTEKDIELIGQLPWIEQDRKLHEFSFQYVDGLLAKLFPSKADLELARSDFKDRCAVKLKMTESQRKAHKVKLPFASRVKTAARIILKGY